MRKQFVSFSCLPVRSGYPGKFIFRRKGLPLRLGRIGAEGLVCSMDISLIPGMPMAKVAIFRNTLAMRRFYNKVLPEYRGGTQATSDRMPVRAAAFVSKLAVDHVCNHTGTAFRTEVDRRYFCLAGFCEGKLTAEWLVHEAVHVGFAWDMRTKGAGSFEDRHQPEENVCYPAGIFVEEVLKVIKSEGLRET